MSYQDRPLVEVLNDLERQAGVNIYCRPQSLHAEGVDTNTPIHLNLSDAISLKSALHIILDQLRLMYIVTPDGVIEIVSEIDLKLVEKSYDISQLTIPRSIKVLDAVSSGGGKNMTTNKGMLDLLTATVYPETWEMADRGISFVENDPHLLVVRQSETVHFAIADLLDQLHRLQDLRVMTTIAEASVSQADLEGFVFEQKLAMPIIKLTEPQAEAFRKLKSLDAKPRRYAAFNGQAITTPKFELQSVVVADRSGVRLSWTPRDSAEAGVKHEDQVASGEMLLIDVTDDSSAKAGKRNYIWISSEVLRATSDRGNVLERAPREEEGKLCHDLPE